MQYLACIYKKKIHCLSEIEIELNVLHCICIPAPHLVRA